MKSEYQNLLKALISNLESMLEIDLGAEDNRHKCADLLFRTYYNINSVEEKELSIWVMNAGSKLDGLIPLEKEDPLYKQEVHEYQEELTRVVQGLKSILTKEGIRVESMNKLKQKMKI